MQREDLDIHSEQRTLDGVITYIAQASSRLTFGVSREKIQVHVAREMLVFGIIPAFI
jgi:hypothetical protein